MKTFYRSDTVVGNARLQYEYQLNKLKLDYCSLQEVIAANDVASVAAELQQRFDLAVGALRGLFNKMPELAAVASSLFVVPTFELPPEQRLIHRIWLGSTPPFEVNEAIRQWFSAINEGAPQTTASFRQILWVWQKEQILSDSRFRSRGGEDPCQLGEIVTDQGSMQVNCLHQLLSQTSGQNDDFIHQLHQQRYYATLSDYFRLLILLEYGGVYMDADTLPYKPVSWFLCRPEIPAIQHFPDASKNPAYLSWLNLFLDETGMIIAAKGEPAIADIFNRLNQAYAGIDGAVPPRNSQWERQVFELFYTLWSEHWNRTFISHELFCQRYAVFFRGEKEEVLCGVRGMRLLEDIISGEHRPLSEQEKGSYQRAVRQLEGAGWQLNTPQELEQLVEIYTIAETPRIAYSLQMRSDIEHFHYYTVLSEDPVLDRVNTLFGHYLLENNSRRIAGGDFWQPAGVTGRAGSASPFRTNATPRLIFAPGVESTDEERQKMARLIFSTSYLEYCSVANPRQMDIVALQRAQNIEPWLSLITVVYKPCGSFAGFFTAGPMAQFEQMPVEYLYREEMQPLDRDYDRFVKKNSRDGDYFIGSLALEAAERGKGYFRLLMAETERQAVRHGASRITLCVWKSSGALPLYKKSGFCQSDSSDRWLSLFADRLCFLEKDLSDS